VYPKYRSHLNTGNSKPKLETLISKNTLIFLNISANMLEHTFIHLPDIGPVRERALWEEGVKTWDDFIARFSSSETHKHYCKMITNSKYALKLSDANHFAYVLPSGETWRAFPHFKRVAYVDIETTGLSATSNDLTVVGLYDGEKVHSYIAGKNIEDFRKHVEKFDMVVTFNGAQFDLPFLRKNMRGIRLPALHVDLRFTLASLDMTGGLKKIEERFGFEREDDLKGLDGYDAVKLWQKYIRRNDTRALDKLVRYNAADISNLKHLMEWVYKEKRKRTGFDGTP